MLSVLHGVQTSGELELWAHGSVYTFHVLFYPTPAFWISLLFGM